MRNTFFNLSAVAMLAALIMSMCIAAVDAKGIQVGRAVYEQPFDNGYSDQIQTITVSVINSPGASVAIGQQQSKTRDDVPLSGTTRAITYRDQPEEVGTITPDEIEEGKIPFNYVCFLTYEQIIDHMEAFFYAEGADSAHFRLEGTNVMTREKLADSLDRVKVTENAKYSATARANQIAGLYAGAIFYLPQSNKVYCLVVSDNGGKTIELVKVGVDSEGYFRFSSIGWMENDYSGAQNNLPENRIETNEIWQIDH